MKEIYKDIKGYDGKYKVSNLGNVMSMNYRGNTKKPKVLVPIRHHLGYLLVHLISSNRQSCKFKMIHTLVAEAFIPNPENKKYVNHIDGCKQNNNVKNLEWVTSKENVNHAIRTGLRDPHKNNHPHGSDVPNSTVILQCSVDGNVIKRWDCISDAARFIGCNPSSIVNNAKGRTKTLHGFIWRYEQ